MESVRENLRFMVHEVQGQVEMAMQFFAEPSRTLVDKITTHDSYIDTLKSLIQDKTYKHLLGASGAEKSRINMLRSADTISSNLERIADFTVNMIRQAQYLTNVGFLTGFEYEAMFEEVLLGLEKIQPALDKREIRRAFRICQCEFNLDSMYAANFNSILDGLRSGGHAGNLITALMIMHYLERMGDSLLNIGEAIIFALIGEKMKIQQYRALTESLNASGLETPISEVEFESIWGTRSGCRIGVVGEADREDPARPVLFKHGNLKKLSKEKDNIAAWEELAPGLPPKVCGFVEGEEGEGSILLEYLPGCTFQELVVNNTGQLMIDAMFMVQETVGHVWSSTIRSEPIRAGFIGQIRDRIDGVYRLHPQFAVESCNLGDYKIRSFGELLSDLDSAEKQLAAPFSVFIHGDFNVNNIIYDNARERIHFIDLHRSGRGDYVQDASVFLVSLFRLPVFESEVRKRLNYALMDFFEFAKAFAQEHGDETFEARLALGLGRSFFTSTRFELNRKFAQKMNMRSIYLLEKLAAHNGRGWSNFELPGEVLVL